jgi:hypothetical protein
MDNLSYMQELKGMPEMILLHIFQYLNNGPFIISYDKIKKCLYICVDKNYPIITRVLHYKQLNPPEYNLYTVGNSSCLTIKIDLCGRGIIIEKLMYKSNNKINCKHIVCYDLKTQKLLMKFAKTKLIPKKKEIETINNLSEKEEEKNKTIDNLSEIIKNLQNFKLKNPNTNLTNEQIKLMFKC